MNKTFYCSHALIRPEFHFLWVIITLASEVRGLQTIYLDVLIGVNVYINYLLLVLTARFAACRQNRIRMVLSALVGALSSCVILLDIPSKLLSGGIKTLTALLMTFIAFDIRSRKMLFRLTAILTTVTFGFAGAMIGVKNIMSTNDIEVSNFSVYLDISPVTLIFFTLVCYVLLSVYSKLTAGRTAQKSACKVTISNMGKSVTLDGLIDTGNALTEPFSGLPVVIVSRKSIYHLLPEEIKDFGAENPQPSRNIRLIPYSSIGGEGLLTGFMPEGITIESEGRESRTENVYVAASEREDIPVIINPDIFV